LAFVGVGASWLSSAGADGPTTIKCTTKAVEEAVEKGGSYLLECRGESIQAPKPLKSPSNGLASGFKVASKKTVSLEAQAGDDATFENAEDRNGRIFTVEKGGALTLTHIVLSAITNGPQGISAGKAKTNGEKGEKGEEEEESLIEELAEEGEGGESHENEPIPESSAAGGDGTRGANGGFVAGKALNAPNVQGGAISNAGTVMLSEDEFSGDGLVAGRGGNGGSGGNGGAGGGGGSGGIGSYTLTCDEGMGITVKYSTPPGAGGDGAAGGSGGPGTIAGNGGEAQGGSVYNSGTLTVQSTRFYFNLAQGGVGGEGGAGGGGGNGGNGGWGYPGGDGAEGGNAGNGGGAGNGASGLGGSIYNTGKLKIEGSQFEEDSASGGEAGSGGQAGNAGKAGNGGSDFSKSECKGEKGVVSVQGAGGDGADGGLGAEGGSGGNGGNAEGGAIYSTTAFALTGTTFSGNHLEAGLGANGTCESDNPCPGKGSGSGEGGGAGSGEPAGSSGNAGGLTGSSGAVGSNGVGLNANIFGQAEGETPEEEGKVNQPGSGPNSSSSSSSSSKSSGGGKDDDEDKEDDDKPSDKDTGKSTTKQSGSTVKVETGETVNCPVGGQDCTAEVTVTISEEMPAGEASSKHKAPKPKIVTIGRAKIVVAPGHSAKIVLSLNSKGAALLRKHHRLNVHVMTIVTEAGAGAVKHTATIPIAQPKPAKHGKKR
jgi:hypothetical protein